MDCSGTYRFYLAERTVCADQGYEICPTGFVEMILFSINPAFDMRPATEDLDSMFEGYEKEEFSGIEHNKAVFKGFFSTLKSYDGYLKFVFMTGVTKFSKVSIFSDLNQLNDISLDLDYSGICGITESEMKENFMPEIQAMAKVRALTVEACLNTLKKMYDGYRFHQSAQGTYNPFSLISALSKKEFGMYWFSTGTPTFLIEKLKESGFDAKRITEGKLYADANILTDYRYDNPNPVPLFYQTGYLTIKGYDEKYRSYRLDYPNDEVRYGFMESLAPMFLQNEDSPDPLDIRSFGIDIETATRTASGTASRHCLQGCPIHPRKKWSNRISRM